MEKTATPENVRARMVFEDLNTLYLCMHFARNAYDPVRYAPDVIQGLEAFRKSLDAATKNDKGQLIATVDEDAAQYARFALCTHYYDGRKFYNAAMYEAVETMFK